MSHSRSLLIASDQHIESVTWSHTCEPYFALEGCFFSSRNLKKLLQLHNQNQLFLSYRMHPAYVTLYVNIGNIKHVKEQINDGQELIYLNGYPSKQKSNPWKINGSPLKANSGYCNKTAWDNHSTPQRRENSWCNMWFPVSGSMAKFNAQRIQVGTQLIGSD